MLSAYDFEVEYRKGLRHGNADSMSRCPNPRDCQCESDDNPLKCGPCVKCRKRSMEMQSVVHSKVGRSNPGTERCGLIRSRVVRKTASCIDWLLCMWTCLLLFPCGGDTKSKSSILRLGGKMGKTTWPLSHVVLKICDWGGSRIVRLKSRMCARGCNVEIITQVKTFTWCALAASWRGVQTFVQNMRRYTTTVRSPAGVNSVNAQIVRRTLGITHNPAYLRKAQKADPDIAPVLRWLGEGHRPLSGVVTGLSAAVRHYWCQWDNLDLREEVLYRQFRKKDGTGLHSQYVVPKSLRGEVLKQMHDGILSGHLGRKKTREKLLQRFYWFGCRDDTDNWIAKCEQCGAVKLPPKCAKAPLGKMMMGAAWDQLSTDLMGPLPLTPRNNCYILVITDQFTKWVEVLAVPDQRAVTCANAIFREVITRFGCPIALHSDQGRSFESEVFSDLRRLLEVRKTRTSVANPKANGQTERFNKTLIHMIKSYLRGEQTTWDEHLGCLAAAYRATPNESTHLTPNMLNLGREFVFRQKFYLAACPTLMGKR